ncbi:MAG: hypothetical protein EHM49_00475 [Deltaproteobacteria bacterium]|nr:MAG: hypothetical protein EHM49_00475 [Deltaproteobacteria bacterium]
MATQKQRSAGSRATPALRQKLSSQALLERTADSHRRINDYGKYGRFYHAPEGKELKPWKCKEGEHIIDIIPFLAGKNHNHTEEGSPTYLVDVWVHQKVGPNENDYVCMARNYNKPCPICDFVNTQKAKDSLLSPEEDKALTEQQKLVLIAAREDALDKCEPKRRCLYNIVCHDSTMQRDLGIQVWEIAHFLFEKKVLAIARMPRGGGFVPFSSPDNGKSICFERQGSGLSNTQYLGHKFVDRPEPIPDEILEAAHTLDELITIPDYEELKKEFLSGFHTHSQPEAGKDAGPPKRDNIPQETEAAAEALRIQKAQEAAAKNQAAKKKATLTQPPIKPKTTPPKAQSTVRRGIRSKR